MSENFGGKKSTPEQSETHLILHFTLVQLMIFNYTKEYFCCCFSVFVTYDIHIIHSCDACVRIMRLQYNTIRYSFRAYIYLLFSENVTRMHTVMMLSANIKILHIVK